jgi:adenylate cyclase
MPPRLTIRVYDNKLLLFEQHVEGLGEIGRQERGEPAPFAVLEREGRWRLVIASDKEIDVGRHHAYLEPLDEDRLRVRNGSTGQPIRLQGRELAPDTSCELTLPAALGLGGKTVRVQAVGAARVEKLPHATAPPRSQPPADVAFPTLLARTAGNVDSTELLGWLQVAIDVLQAAADSADFFDRAAGAAVDMVDLDSAQILLREGGEWRSHAARQGPRVSGQVVRRPSRHILGRMLEEKRTYWEMINPGSVEHDSLAQVEAVVAAPILDRQGAVLGALHGERQRGGSKAATGHLTQVEAMLVELLARGVAAGLARLEQEKAALAERVRFEQFFTPDLARQLSQNPDLLKGRDAEVTVLFCDVRGFSRFSAELGPARTVEWINNVLDELSECVLHEAGVLVTYVGDELQVMWGAPQAQPDHASRACRAALAMLERLPHLNARWQSTLRGPFDLGIGINSGPAHVGNTGSRSKFNYGPLGNTVNLASRVQHLTGELRCRLLITGATHAQFGADFATRRLGRFQLGDPSGPTELYELRAGDTPGWAEARAEYEKALALFEQGQFGPAAQTLGNWRGRRPDDGTALVLLDRAVRSLVEGLPASAARVIEKN